MIDVTTKKLREALKAEVKPVREMVEVVSHKVRQIDNLQFTTSENIRKIRDQQSVMNEKLDIHRVTLDAHTETLVKFENETIPLVREIHTMLKDQGTRVREIEYRVDDLEPRVNALEAVVAK